MTVVVEGIYVPRRGSLLNRTAVVLVRRVVCFGRGMSGLSSAAGQHEKKNKREHQNPLAGFEKQVPRVFAVRTRGGCITIARCNRWRFYFFDPRRERERPFSTLDAYVCMTDRSWPSSPTSRTRPTPGEHVWSFVLFSGSHPAKAWQTARVASIAHPGSTP